MRSAIKHMGRSVAGHGHDEDDIIIAYHDATLRQLDLETLEADEWVNDAVIGFCYEILSRQFLHMAFWPPAVVELLCTLGSNDSGTSARGSISSSREAMSELLPAATQATFLPVSDKYGDPSGVSSHWTCLFSRQSARAPGEHEGVHFDSMAAPANAQAAKLTFQVLAGARGAHGSRLLDARVPPQANASDCGLYVILLPFAHLLGRWTDDDTDRDAVPTIEALDATASQLTPARIAAFRHDLRVWIGRWAALPRDTQATLTSWDAIVRAVGPLSLHQSGQARCFGQQ